MSPSTTPPAAAAPASAAAPAANADANGASGPHPALPPEALDLAAKLFDLARAGDASLLPYVDAGIPANLTNSAGDTLLMLAAYHGHVELVRGLLARGADPDAVNGKGQAPIAGAVFKGHEGVVRALFDAGADVTAGHPNARDCAVMFRREDYVQLFASRS
ncbi:ankyrin [Cutaneotrichosporon oleaginosum]|uniref:Ankyrin n=1 Tax=Cutaneotrichosporon oleaginosum TaxID=879819 RepID=A0A0J0XP46_9TREE|nr:ankyrin [Cutaneotrichosporon oleaginosum]KLT42885.1 ankyrin [Cutaneotrichosporon oleaginosum]TXT12589.1 hypothetical protein COLE_02999 [Cutaneotrichosporon oleaginosum]